MLNEKNLKTYDDFLIHFFLFFFKDFVLLEKNIFLELNFFF